MLRVYIVGSFLLDGSGQSQLSNRQTNKYTAAVLTTDLTTEYGWCYLIHRPNGFRQSH